MAFGLSVVTMLYAIGHVSVGHLNQAVSIDLMIAKRFPASEVPGYIAAQVVGAILDAGVLYLSSPAGGPASCPAASPQRVWRALSGRLFAAGRVLRRSGAHVHVPDYHSGRRRGLPPWRSAWPWR